MPDIGLVWDAAHGRGDWATAGQTPYGSNDGTGGDLTAAVMVSLFTDRRADPSDAVDGDDRRGWWADAYEDTPIGSRLWLLERAKRIPQTLTRAETYAAEALQWLVADEIATNVTIQAVWIGSEGLGLVITITQAKGPGAVLTVTLPWGRG